MSSLQVWGRVGDISEGRDGLCLPRTRPCSSLPPAQGMYVCTTYVCVCGVCVCVRMEVCLLATSARACVCA